MLTRRRRSTSFVRDLTEAKTATAAGDGLAVLIPCYNEEAAIGDVVMAFRAALPAARINLYHNNSDDRARQLLRLPRHRREPHLQTDRQR